MSTCFNEFTEDNQDQDKNSQEITLIDRLGGEEGLHHIV